MPKYFSVPIPQLIEIKKTKKTVYTTFYPHELTETPIFTIRNLCFLDAFLDFSFALSSPIEVSRGSNHVTLRSGTFLLSTVKRKKEGCQSQLFLKGTTRKRAHSFWKFAVHGSYPKMIFRDFLPDRTSRMQTWFYLDFHVKKLVNLPPLTNPTPPPPETRPN